MTFPIFPPTLPSRIAVPNWSQRVFARFNFKRNFHDPIDYSVIIGLKKYTYGLCEPFKRVIKIATVLLILSSCHPDPFPSCSPLNDRKMPLVGTDKCGCLYGIPAVPSTPDSLTVRNGIMYTTDRKPCL